MALAEAEAQRRAREAELAAQKAAVPLFVCLYNLVKIATDCEELLCPGRSDEALCPGDEALCPGRSEMRNIKWRPTRKHERRHGPRSPPQHLA